MTAGPTNAVHKLEQAQSRWIPDFAEISMLYRQLTSVIETRWDELPSEFKAWRNWQRTTHITGFASIS
ncbi:MAG: hypothetical protein HC933_21065 [Pleurocapsa sp. SU_196_0]|nr:hypothetical protein [Pleurocapsa sp. SU_196_0]